MQNLTAKSDRDLVNIARKQNIKNTIGNTLAGGLTSGGMTYAINPHLSPAERLKYSAIVGGSMAAANAIAGGINQARLRRIASNKGHAKAVAKQREFEKEMRKSFKGTQYAKQINKTKSAIRDNINMAKNGANYSNLTSAAPKKKTSSNGWNDQRVQQGMNQWMNTFEKKYQQGLSRGMSHEQAERYSNNYIAKNGFGSKKKSR